MAIARVNSTESRKLKETTNATIKRQKMICQICGKNYVALGVHVKVKHGIEVADYKSEFGLLKTAPLVDADLSEYFSKMAKITFATRTSDEQDEIRARCRDNSKVGCPKGAMSEAGKVALGSRNKQRNESYLKDRAPAVAEILDADQFSVSVRRKIGTGHSTVLAMRDAGLVSYDPGAVEAARLAKVKRTVDARRNAEISKVLALYDSNMTLAEICRQVGVGKTTYKTWRSSGLIANRKTYMKPAE